MTNINGIASQLFNSEDVLKSAFGYSDDWRIFMVRDCRNYFWFVDDSGLKFHETDVSGEYDFSANLIKHQSSKKSIWEKDGMYLILMDTRCDGNIYLGLFDGSLKRAPRYELDDDDDDDDLIPDSL